MIKKFTINAEITVEDYLLATLKLSRAQVRRLKNSAQGLMVNESHQTVKYTLQKGDVLAVLFGDDSPRENIIPTTMPLDIIFEDDDIAAVNKPQAMPTHPSRRNPTNTLANGVCAYFAAKTGEPFVFRALNRLDKDTSGIVVIAKHAAAANVNAAIAAGRFYRRYIGVVDGALDPASGTIDAPIARLDAASIKRVVDSSGKTAITHYESIATNGEQSLVRFELETGRTHQIRVHMAHIGHPISGDALYGKPSQRFPSGALHCECLRFEHPITGKTIDLYSKPPAGFNLD